MVSQVEMSNNNNNNDNDNDNDNDNGNDNDNDNDNDDNNNNKQCTKNSIPGDSGVVSRVDRNSTMKVLQVC